nr:DUF805 domain-containing protein [Aureimonas sp. ME7]
MFVLAHLVPYLCVLARRLHDTDASGWWALVGLIPVVGLVMLIPAAFKGTAGPNRFGQEPVTTLEAVPDHARTAATNSRYEPHLTNAPGPQSDRPLRAAPPRPAMAEDLVSQLEKLADMRADGTLTQAEFDTMKARLMAPETGR